MIKDKLFIIASNIDDSIKAVTPVYDMTIIPTWVEFENYISSTPQKLDTIIVSGRELPFTSTNMERLLGAVNSKFLKMSGKCLYLVDEETDLKVVRDFFADDNVENIVCYQGDLSMQYISEIIDGSARESDESETEAVTYRYRAKEYVEAQNVKKYITDEDRYQTDEDWLSDVPPIEEPVTVTPSVEITTNCYYIVGKQSIERSLFSFLEAQYLSLSGKVLIMESDVEYHTLTDIISKSSIRYDYYEMSDFRINISNVVESIKMSQERIIFIGCSKRIEFNYSFMFDLLLSNLEGTVDYFIKECDFDQTPYGEYYTIVCEDTVPKVLECVNSLMYEVDSSKVRFVGIRTRDIFPVNISSQEMTDIIQVTMNDKDIKADVISAYGIALRGEEFVYDLFSIIGRGNPRQS